jgi:hypothetical protein
MSDYFCHPHAPEEFKEMVPDTARLQQWVKSPRSDKELSDALEWIYVHHVHHRGIIEGEIEDRRYKESLAASRGANTLAKWAIVIAIGALIISAVQTFW